MINVIAVDSIRTLTFSAVYGFSLVFFYLVVSLFFLFYPDRSSICRTRYRMAESGGVIYRLGTRKKMKVSCRHLAQLDLQSHLVPHDHGVDRGDITPVSIQSGTCQ